MSKKDDLEKRFNTLITNLQENFGLSMNDIIDMSTKVHPSKTINIPIDALKNRDLGMLESIVIYLKDTKGLRFSDIARLLDRNDRTIWTTYKKGKEKIGDDR